jgi:hypothetical protein
MGPVGLDVLLPAYSPEEKLVPRGYVKGATLILGTTAYTQAQAGASVNPEPRYWM